jgi:formylglycine-generating enzyme required for sulfatase activity
MTAKAKIKVIKKSEISNAEKPVEQKKETAQASARDMVSNVTNWVNDFQQRRREETKQAIEKFFSQQPQTSV